MSEPIYPTYSNIKVFKHTYDIATYLLKKNIPGDIVECGIAAGSNFAQMIKACQDLNQNRLFWGYDSFEGIPFAGAKDTSQPGLPNIDKSKLDKLESSGITVHEIRGVIANLEKWGVYSENVKLVKGWFQDTLPKIRPESIAILRLDGDLYSSTMVCLEHLYPLISNGGLVLIDDYELTGCHDAVHEYISKNKLKVKIERFDYTAYFYKP